MHDFFNKLSPSNISYLFDCSNEIHNFNTRFSLAGNYYIKYSRSNHLLKSFQDRGQIMEQHPTRITQITKMRI